MSTPPRKILLNPGPATTSITVKRSQVVADICPREKEFADLMKSISQKLCEIVADNDNYKTVLFGGSGTAAVEATLSSVVGSSDKLLIVDNGAYGKRMVEIAKIYQLPFCTYTSSPYDPISIQELSKFIDEQQEITHLAIVHNETTTGLLNDLDALSSITKKYSLKVIVDAMSSFGAIPLQMQLQNLHYVIASSNKNVQGMAGVSFVICHKNSLLATNQLPPRNYYLNLYQQYLYFEQKDQTRFTPPVQCIYALAAALEELKKEGIQQRYERYSAMWESLCKGMALMGFSHTVAKENHSKIITEFKLKPNVKFNDLHDYLYKKDITIYPSKTGTDSFRIANIGDLSILDIQTALEVIAQYLKEKHIE